MHNISVIGRTKADKKSFFSRSSRWRKNAIGDGGELEVKTGENAENAGLSFSCVFEPVAIGSPALLLSALMESVFHLKCYLKFVVLCSTTMSILVFG